MGRRRNAANGRLEEMGYRCAALLTSWLALASGVAGCGSAPPEAGTDAGAVADAEQTLPGPDAGALLGADAESPPADAASAVDASLRPDAATSDAGHPADGALPSDASLPADGGDQADAALPADAGELLPSCQRGAPLDSLETAAQIGAW